MTRKTFSVIIPTYNRINDLWRCLNSFACIDYPKNEFEIIVVDDGNERADRAVLHYKHQKLNIKLIQSKGVGPAKARNKGVEAAEGIFLAFTDDDCTVETQWLKNLEKQLKNTNANLIGGHTFNKTDNIYSTASQELINYLYSYYKGKFFCSNNFAVSTEAFQKIGGFNTTFHLAGGEDREFCDRWIHSGNNTTYAEEIIVYHWHELNSYTFCKQQFNYGRGAFLFQQIISERGVNKKLQHPSFYINLLIYPFLHIETKKLSIAILFLISQVAITAGLLWESWHHPNHEE